MRKQHLNLRHGAGISKFIGKHVGRVGCIKKNVVCEKIFQEKTICL